MDLFDITFFQRQYEVVAETLSKILKKRGITYIDLSFNFRKLKDSKQDVIVVKGYNPKMNQNCECYINVEELQDELREDEW